MSGFFAPPRPDRLLLPVVVLWWMVDGWVNG